MADQNKDDSTRRTRHPHPSIAHHGVIGDMATAALVSTQGAIDFLCWPRFDSPSIFAKLLDDDAGSFDIEPCFDADPRDIRYKQIYLPDTNVLITRFLSLEAVAEITDFMAVGDGPQRLVRRVSCVRGDAHFKMRCAPRFDYARADHTANSCRHDYGVRFDVEEETQIRLTATVLMTIDDRHDALADFTLKEGESATFVIDAPPIEEDDRIDDIEEYSTDCFHETVDFWREWLAQSHYRGHAEDIVRRSALALKLLTSSEFGSIVAAPTFGLPETMGGGRNWDYRYTWIRDAAFTLYALVRLGFTSEAVDFMHWTQERLTNHPESGAIQIMYGIDGREELTESELDHFSGYADSKPVRIGNAAYDQLQLDSYGALMDAVYLSNKYAEPISYDGWRAVTQTVNWVCDNWHRKDEGIWEFRGGQRHFLSSRLMCWVTVDRALRMAQKNSLPGPVSRWQEVRNEIHYSVYDDFWNEEMQAFVQYKGSKAMDASCLLMPLVKFISPTDPRWLSTLDAVEDHLTHDALVHRYDVDASAEIDGLDGEEGSFTVCSFWYVECLARAGRMDEARLLFDKLLSYANHLGLFSEELGPSGDMLGNFPQALTHLALISAAHSISEPEKE